MAKVQGGGGGGGEYMKDHIFELRIKDMKTRLDIAVLYTTELKQL